MFEENTIPLCPIVIFGTLPIKSNPQTFVKPTSTYKSCIIYWIQCIYEFFKQEAYLKLRVCINNIKNLMFIHLSQIIPPTNVMKSSNFLVRSEFSLVGSSTNQKSSESDDSGQRNDRGSWPLFGGNGCIRARGPPLENKIHFEFIRKARVFKITGCFNPGFFEVL